MTELLAVSTAPAVSADFTVGAGKELVVSLKRASALASLLGAAILVQRKDGAGVYTTIAELDEDTPAVTLHNPATVDQVFRVERPFTPSAVGVDTETAQYRVVTLPPVLLTGTTNPRVRVDVGQTGFFEKREFRTYREFSQPDSTHIPTGQRVLLRAIVPINIILLALQFDADNGQIRVRTYLGGTPAGTFSAMPVIAANAMSEGPAAYTAQVAIDITQAAASPTVGLTGGTQLDAIRLRVENASGSAASVGAIEDSVRGLPAATYYILVENIGAGSYEGVVKARWEERP